MKINMINKYKNKFLIFFNNNNIYLMTNINIKMIKKNQ